LHNVSKMKYRKIGIGIDIAKDDFHACLKILLDNGETVVKGSRTFSNNIKGFKELSEWVIKRKKDCNKVLLLWKLREFIMKI